MRECSSCQTVNDNSAQFCLECGQKLAPAGRSAAPDEQPNTLQAPGRQKLHSPILGGYEDIDDTPRKAEKPRNTEPRAKGAHLRSPLLGGGDDDEPVEDPTVKPIKGRGQQPRQGGKMRSPLLGGGGGAQQDDDYEEDFPLRDRNDDRSPFPHRNRPRTADPEMPAPNQHSGKAHLRSPLLGGSDDDDEADQFPMQPTGRKAQAGGRPVKLHSPMFDRASSSGGYDDYEDEEVDDVDDPNVLRSPLLAAKSRLPQNPGRGNQPRPYPPAAPGQNQAGNAAPNNFQQGNPQAGYPQPNAGQQAYLQPQAPVAQQNIQPGPGQPGGFQPPAPQAPGQQPGGQPGFSSPPINIQQPGFAPPINPNASMNGLQPSPLPGAPGSYEYGAPASNQSGSPAGGGFPSPQPMAQGSDTLIESKVQFPQPSAPAAKNNFPAPSGTISGAAQGSSGLGQKPTNDDTEFTPHPAVDDFAPQARVKPPKLGGGRFALPAPTSDNLSDDDDDDYSAGPRGKGLPLSAQEPIGRRRGPASKDDAYNPGSALAGAPSGPIMIVFVTGFLGTISKLYFMFSFFKSFSQSMPMLLDQVGQLAVFVGLIFFAMQGSRK